MYDGKVFRVIVDEEAYFVRHYLYGYPRKVWGNTLKTKGERDHPLFSACLMSYFCKYVACH